MTRQIALLSDLHNEHKMFNVAPFYQKLQGVDLIVLAGDIQTPNETTNPVSWALDQLPDVPVVFVPGNHDFYGGVPTELLAQWKAQAKGTRVRVLYNDVFDWDGVNILGTPLWSGLDLYGPVHKWQLEKVLPMSIADFRAIKLSANKLWTVGAMLNEHAQALAFLRAQLAKGGTNVVVTHWCPHEQSVDAQFRGDPLTPYFVNHLPELVEQADMWLHGHKHADCHYQVGNNPRKGVVHCHPRGYPNEEARKGPYAPQFIEVDA